jgi:hypothetical protein
MTSWKTTVSAIVIVICGFILFDPQWFPAIIISMAKFIGLGGVAALGISAKDFNVTGTKKE